METARLIVEIVLCLVIIVVGGGLAALVVWFNFRLGIATAQMAKLIDLFEKVIDNEAAIAAQAEDMAKAVTDFKSSAVASVEALVKVVTTNIVGVEGLAKAVKLFEKSLLDLSSGKKPAANYGVSPDIEGLSRDEIEKREADEMVRAATQVERVWESKGPEIIAT